MADVADHYDASSSTYSEQYDESRILTSEEYPANFFRLKRVKERVPGPRPDQHLRARHR